MIAMPRWLAITKIGTKEDEESGLLMGFWRSLSGQPVVQIAASRTLPVRNSALHCILSRLSRQLHCGLFGRVGWSAATGGWAGQRSSGVQEVGPLTPSLHPSPPPCSAQNQHRELGRGNNIATGVNHLVLQVQQGLLHCPHTLALLLSKHLNGCLQCLTQ